MQVKPLALPSQASVNPPTAMAVGPINEELAGVVQSVWNFQKSKIGQLKTLRGRFVAREHRIPVKNTGLRSDE